MDNFDFEVVTSVLDRAEKLLAMNGYTVIKPNLVTKQCAQCSGYFTSKKTNCNKGSGKIYCSEGCKQKAYRTRKQETSNE